MFMKGFFFFVFFFFENSPVTYNVVGQMIVSYQVFSFHNAARDYMYTCIHLA